jgi:hypothetical protein
MPDDPSALADPERAVAGVIRAFRSCKGEAWGDALPHHPHQRPEMSWEEIDRLHQRPTRLPATALDLDEVDYFFAHASYSAAPHRDVPPALRYFLPRLASYFAQPDAEHVGAMLWPEPFGDRLAVARWTAWPPRWRTPIEAFLTAWAAAACRWVPEASERTHRQPPPHRDPADVRSAVLVGGLSPVLVRSILDSPRGAALARTASSLLAFAEDVGAATVRRDSVRPLVDWLQDPATAQALLAEACQDVPWRVAAGQVFDRLG